MREGHLGVMDIERKYSISHSVIIKWLHIDSEEGTEGFMNPERRRARPGRKRKGEEPPELEIDFKGDLAAENRWLRMENDYLKKLNALVQAEEQKNGKKRK